MRRVAEHQLNRDSSRSHCLLTVHIDSVQMVEGHEQHCKGKITFVDLAGSERLKDSQSAGSTLKETGSINRSLFTLGKVISSLCDKKSVKVIHATHIFAGFLHVNRSTHSCLAGALSRQQVDTAAYG